MGTIWQQELISDQGPKYRAVAEIIRAAVAGGALCVGEKLPPVRDLAWKLKITPGTVARAYTILTEEGLLQAEVGRGTFVAPPKPPLSDEPYIPIEIDAIPHGSQTDSHRVNFFSPVLPNIGQANLIKTLLREVADDPPSGVMHYPSRAASRAARGAALHWLSGCPLGPLDQEDIVLTLGGQHAVVVALQSILHGRRPTVLVEELSYSGFRRAAELMRANVVAVPMDEHGVIPEALAAAARGCDAQAFCTSPEVHNPTTVTTPLERREAIAKVARDHDFQIIEDDCYRMGTERDASYRQLAPERGWYVSSIAKTVTPALRLGFAIAPLEKTSNLRRAVEHGMFGLPTPMIDLAAKLLLDPRLPPLALKAQQIYAEYADSAAAILEGHMLAWRKDVPFLWLTLPLGWRAGAFCQAAEAADVPLRSAEEFAGRDTHAPHAVRLALNAGVSKESFDAAIGRLRHLLDNPPEQIGV